MFRHFFAGTMASLLLVCSCIPSSPEKLPGFDKVYSDFIAIIDNPDSSAGNVLKKSGLKRIFSGRIVPSGKDTVRKSVVIYASGVKAAVKGTEQRYSTESASEHAMGVRIEEYFDPEVYVDFRDPHDAEEFYKQIENYGMLADRYGNKYVTEQRIGKVVKNASEDEFAKYLRTIRVYPPRQLLKGWYTVAFVN